MPAPGRNVRQMPLDRFSAGDPFCRLDETPPGTASGNPVGLPLGAVAGQEIKAASARLTSVNVDCRGGAVSRPADSANLDQAYTIVCRGLSRAMPCDNSARGRGDSWENRARPSDAGLSGAASERPAAGRSKKRIPDTKGARRFLTTRVDLNAVTAGVARRGPLPISRDLDSPNRLGCTAWNMVDEQDIYEEHVLDHYEDPYHRGTPPSATHQHEGKNPLCGDVIQISLRLDPQGRIEEAWFEGEGCVISQASASMLAEKIEGMTVEQAQEFSAHEMLNLFGPQLTPNRQKCCLLGWRVLQSAIHSPVDEDDEEGGPHFGGPSLSEES